LRKTRKEKKTLEKGSIVFIKTCARKNVGTRGIASISYRGGKIWFEREVGEVQGSYLSSNVDVFWEGKIPSEAGRTLRFLILKKRARGGFN